MNFLEELRKKYPTKVVVPKEIYDQMIACARAFAPNEAHGYLFKENTIFKCGKADRASPAGFVTNPQHMFNLIRQYGKPSGFFHSHPCGAEPSLTDLQHMQSTMLVYGKVPWYILSIENELKAWIYKQEMPVEIK